MPRKKKIDTIDEKVIIQLSDKTFYPIRKPFIIDRGLKYVLGFSVI